jgi:sugar phosphate isomerase/epimerase
MTDDKGSIHLGGTARSPQDVRQLHDLGLQFGEIPITNPKRFKDRVEQYARLGDKLGMYYLCHGPREGDPNDMEGLEKTYLPKVLGILPLMTQLRTTLLTVHLWLDSRFVREEVIRFKITLLQRVIDKAQERGIVICLENLSERISDMKTALDDLPLLNLTLDLGHGQLLTDRNRSYDFIARYPRKIRHIHLHDNKGGDSPLDDLHLPPGEGIIDFGRILKGLRAIGYDRTVTLELRPDEIKTCLGRVRKMLLEA